MLLRACQIFIFLLVILTTLTFKEKDHTTLQPAITSDRSQINEQGKNFVSNPKADSGRHPTKSGEVPNNSDRANTAIRLDSAKMRPQSECTASRPIIIIKADDFGDLTLNWQKFVDIIKDNHICASLGVYPAAISSDASVNSLKELASLKQPDDPSQPVFELWNHGFNHNEYNTQKLYYDSLQPAFADYDDDGKIDVSVKTHRGKWLIDFSSNNEGFHVWDEVYGFYGDATAHPVPADYDGDRKADLSVKTDNGDWFIDLVGNGFGCWDQSISGCGGASARPVPADYDGDHKADLSVLTSTGDWLIDYAANGFGRWDIKYHHYGSPRTKPVPADYDGDGKADLSIYLPNGSWLVDLSTTGFGTWDLAAGSNAFRSHANASNIAVAADYDGDCKADLSIVNSKGDWFIDMSNNGFGNMDQQTKRVLNYPRFTPVPEDFDGVGHAQESILACAAPSNEFTWLIDAAGTGVFQVGLKHVGEFSGTPQPFQATHIRLTQQYFQDVLGRESHTFGAPFNGSDAQTNVCISNLNDLNIWLLYLPIMRNGRNVGGNDIHPDKRWKDAKLGLGPKDNHMFLNIDRTYYNSYDDFKVQPIIDNYPADSSAPYMMLQVHPNAWQDASFFTDFNRLIQFYKENGAVFMTPYQYFQYLHSTEVRPE